MQKDGYAAGCTTWCLSVCKKNSMDETDTDELACMIRDILVTRPPFSPFMHGTHMNCTYAQHTCTPTHTHTYVHICMYVYIYYLFNHILY